VHLFVCYAVTDLKAQLLELKHIKNIHEPIETIYKYSSLRIQNISEAMDTIYEYSYLRAHSKDMWGYKNNRTLDK